MGLLSPQIQLLTGRAVEVCGERADANMAGPAVGAEHISHHVDAECARRSKLRKEAHVAARLQVSNWPDDRASAADTARAGRMSLVSCRKSVITFET
jgi:hypothetical protein